MSRRRYQNDLISRDFEITRCDRQVFCSNYTTQIMKPHLRIGKEQRRISKNRRVLGRPGIATIRDAVGGFISSQFAAALSLAPSPILVLKMGEGGGRGLNERIKLPTCLKVSNSPTVSSVADNPGGSPFAHHVDEQHNLPIGSTL